jgi:uncharacterized membrane protein
MHASTRILLILAAGGAIVAGWWLLLAINSVLVGSVYSILWTLAVLIVARVLMAVGFGYNRFTAKRGRHQSAESRDTATALAELTDLRDRGLITPEEYDVKRSKVVQRL